MDLFRAWLRVVSILFWKFNAIFSKNRKTSDQNLWTKSERISKRGPDNVLFFFSQTKIVSKFSEHKRTIFHLSRWYELPRKKVYLYVQGLAVGQGLDVFGQNFDRMRPFSLRPSQYFVEHNRIGKCGIGCREIGISIAFETRNSSEELWRKIIEKGVWFIWAIF